MKDENIEMLQYIYLETGKAIFYNYTFDHFEELLDRAKELAEEGIVEYNNILKIYTHKESGLNTYFCQHLEYRFTDNNTVIIEYTIYEDNKIYNLEYTAYEIETNGVFRSGKKIIKRI